MNTKQHWNEVYKKDITFSPVSEILLDWLNLKGTKALDIGCGRGQLMEQLKARGFEVRGIDLSDYSADIVGDFMTYKFEDKFDVIFINKVIAFNDPQAFLERARELLTDEGKIVIITPVILPEYAQKVSERVKSISLNWDDFRALGGMTVNTNFFEDYGAEFTVVIDKTP